MVSEYVRGISAKTCFRKAFSVNAFQITQRSSIIFFSKASALASACFLSSENDEKLASVVSIVSECDEALASGVSMVSECDGTLASVVSIVSECDEALASVVSMVSECDELEPSERI